MSRSGGPHKRDVVPAQSMPVGPMKEVVYGGNGLEARMVIMRTEESE